MPSSNARGKCKNHPHLPGVRNRLLCNECFLAYARQVAARYYAKNRKTVLRRQGDRYANQKQVEIVVDPSGDFPKGVTFPKIQVAYGLAEGAWIDGTIFRVGKKHFAMSRGLLVDDHGSQVILVKHIGW
mgnify:CR=1 FL=1